MRTILHSDVNGFFASVECLYHPELRNKPVAVGGDPELRHGIILAKNELAKKYKIATGEAIWQARAKCPDLVVLPPDYPKYLRFAKLTREIYMEYTDQVEAFGLDEAWLDVTGSAIFGEGVKIAHNIKKRIKNELGITVSIGVSYNKVMAKMGSDLKKPDAVTLIRPEDVKEKIWKLPASDLMFIGPATARKLRDKYAIYTIKQVAEIQPEFLCNWFGINGHLIWQYANGIDNSEVSSINSTKEADVIKSIGNSTTTPHDLMDEDDFMVTAWVLTENVAARLRKHNLLCNTVQVYLRENDMNSYERQVKLFSPTQISCEIADAALKLYRKAKPEKPLRSIGIRACNLVCEDEVYQLSLIDVENKRVNKLLLEQTIDKLRERFGSTSIERAIMLRDRMLSSINPSDEFSVQSINFNKSL